jgi:hypothetical protein
VIRPPLTTMPLSCPSPGLCPSSCADFFTSSRFLRARNFDPAKAHKQFAATEAWRRENRVLELYATFDSDELESAKRFYPCWTGRRDKVSVNLSALCRSLDWRTHSTEYPSTSSAWHHWQARFKKSSTLFRRIAAISACASLVPVL